MNKADVKELNRELTYAIMEMPHSFKIEGEVFYVYPLTLGKTLILQSMMERAAIKEENLKVDINLELLRVVEANKDVCCELMAYMTARNDYYDVFDIVGFERRKAVFMGLEDSDLASFVAAVLTADKTSYLIKGLGIDKEQADMRKVTSVKDKSDKNTFSFGGLTLYGSLIDVAMERYAMTKRQIVWEMDYVSLRLLLADKVTSVFVTDDERKKIHVPKDRHKINGDDKETMLRMINSTDWD